MSDPHKHHTHETAPMHDPVDAWHDHSHDAKPQAAHAEVQNTPLIMAVGLGLFMVIVVSVVAVYGFYTWYVARTLNAQEITTAGAPALEFRKTKNTALDINRDGGTVMLAPLEEGKPKRSITILPFADAQAAVLKEYTPKAAQKN